MALCDCLSADKNVPVFRSPYRYFCQRLSDCERPNDWNSLSDLRDNSQRTEKPEKGRDGNLPIHFLFFFFSRLKCWSFFFTLSGCVAYCEDGTSVLLPRLSVYTLTPKIDTGQKERQRLKKGKRGKPTDGSRQK